MVRDFEAGIHRNPDEYMDPVNNLEHRTILAAIAWDELRRRDAIEYLDADIEW